MEDCNLTSFQVGYTFKNYKSPSRRWGTVLTADDMRYTYMAGIDLVLTTGQEVQDEQLENFVELAMAEFETLLGIVIRKRIYRTNYSGDDERLPNYDRDTTKWTHIESPYPFIRRQWENNGYIQLNNRPLISVERCILKTPIDSTLINLLDNNWVRIDYASGQLRMFPRTGYPSYGPYYGSSGLILDRMRGDYHDAYEVDYTAGYEKSDFVPNDLRQVIGELAAVGLLNWVGDGLMAGFSSSSVSLDGLSESFSSTQSATSAYFGARVKEYRDHIKQWLKVNRYKHANIPMAFA